MKLFLNITFNIKHDRLMYLMQQFEGAGFEVLEESVENVGLWITEVKTETIDKCDYVVVINQDVWLHCNFFQKVQHYLEMKLDCFGCERVLYSNADMGLIDAEEKNNPRLMFVHRLLVLGDIFKASRQFKEMYDEKPMICSIVDDKTFIGKNGRFHCEFLTSEILTNGSW